MDVPDMACGLAHAEEKTSTIVKPRANGNERRSKLFGKSTAGCYSLQMDFGGVSEAINHGRRAHLHIFRNYFDACEGPEGSS